MITAMPLPKRRKSFVETSIYGRALKGSQVLERLEVL